MQARSQQNRGQKAHIAKPLHPIPPCKEPIRRAPESYRSQGQDILHYRHPALCAAFLSANNGTGLARKGGQNLNGQAKPLRQLDGPVMKHLRTAGYEPAHFFIRDPVKFHGVGVQPGVFVVNAVHVGVDLAQVRVEKHRQGHRRGVGATPGPEL